MKKNKLLKIEKDSNFAARILALSLPSALVFIMLVSLHLLPASIAIIAYATIILFNIVWLFPITFELQQIKKYISRLSKNETLNIEDFELTETETKEIVEALNQMHKFWAARTEDLEAQTISDTAVLDTLPDPILMINQQGNITGANLSARNLLGDDITDKNIDKIFSSNNFINAVARVLNQESAAENLIFYVTKPANGRNLEENFKLYAHIKELPWISRGHAVAVISLYDLTKSLKVEKMQSDFVANASHELRTPLSVISGFIETLQTTAKDDVKAREIFLKIMGEQASFMSLLIENLLSLSKIELHQDLPPEDKIKVKPIVEEVVRSMSGKAKTRGMIFDYKINKNLPEITADYAQVRQLIQNLTDNAVKYGEDNSTVTIKAIVVDKIPQATSHQVATGQAVAISVHNVGEPISPEYINRLTERFYRMQTHKDKSIKGSGLGLAIAKHIIIRHQGNMKITSTAKTGTTATIYLPVEQNSE